MEIRFETGGFGIQVFSKPKATIIWKKCDQITVKYVSLKKYKYKKQIVAFF